MPTDRNNIDGAITRRYAPNHADVWYAGDGSSWKQLKAGQGPGHTTVSVFPLARRRARLWDRELLANFAPG